MSARLTKDRRGRLRFSLGSMLTLTAIIAVWFAAILALRKSTVLEREKAALAALSSQLDVNDLDQVQASAYPRVTDDFASWEVHIPDKESFELRLAFDEVSQAGMPQAFEKVALEPGQHRITLYFADSANEDYHYTVFVDGKTVFDRAMGRDWMPNGWRQASGLNSPPSQADIDSTMLSLQGKTYTPAVDYGPNGYFSSQSDDWVSGPGYRLWIDHAERSYAATSPFMGFKSDPQYRGIGLRDGLRYLTTRNTVYEWSFIRPAAHTNDPVLTIVPEFFVGDRVVLSDQTKEFAQWRLRNEPAGINPLSWQRDPPQTSYSAFLHCKVESPGTIEPVVEIRWDADRPNDVGLRLADTPANETLTKWRLKVVGGTRHLWRVLDIDDRSKDVRENFSDESQPSLDATVPISFNKDPDKPHVIAWRSDISKPLQLLTRNRNKPTPYLGIDLFQGLPLAFGAEIPRTLQPSAAIVGANSYPDTPRTLIPGGPVVAEIHIDLDATVRDWVWLRAEPI